MEDLHDQGSQSIADRADDACTSARNPASAASYQMHGKNIVRISPALLGRIGETARLVTEGSLVRFLPAP